MKKYLWIGLTVVGLGISCLIATEALADAGSGQSAGNRSDNYVVICHYDRNQQGPNAGPHTITINANALDQHLVNHVKKEGFVGDDSTGPCPGETPQPTRTAPASTRTVEPTQGPD